MNARKPNRKLKRPSISKEVEKAAVLLQKLVRMKSANSKGFSKCITCGKWVHYKSADGGHYFSRRHLRLKLLEENLAIMCKGCNMRMGCPTVHDEYRTYMVDMYGAKRVEAMKRLTRWSKPKFKMEEVKEFQKYLREQIKIQQKRLGEI